MTLHRLQNWTTKKTVFYSVIWWEHGASTWLVDEHRKATGKWGCRMPLPNVPNVNACVCVCGCGYYVLLVFQATHEYEWCFYGNANDDDGWWGRTTTTTTTHMHDWRMNGAGGTISRVCVCIYCITNDTHEAYQRVLLCSIYTSMCVTLSLCKWYGCGWSSEVCEIASTLHNAVFRCDVDNALR